LSTIPWPGATDDQDRYGHAGVSTASEVRALPPADPRLDIGGIVRALVRIAQRYPTGLGEYDVLFL
jgi:hypothetical protein